MDSSKIESMAIHRLKDIILQSDILKEYLNENDKTPSWDGNIFLYKSSEQKKENIDGVIPVQVKGKYVNKFSKKELPYPVEVSDLKNYLENGGVMFFVIEIINFHIFRIYYNSLVPVDIKEILDDLKEGQKEKSIKLRMLVNPMIMNLETQLKNFVINQRLQYSTYKYTRSIDKDQKVESIFFTVDHGNIPIEEFVLNNDIRFYIKENKDSVPIPAKGKVRIQSVEKSVNRQIFVNDKKYYEGYEVIKRNDGNFLKIGECTTLDIENHVVTFKAKGGLKKQLIDHQFMDDVIFNKKFLIEDVGDITVEMSDENKKIVTNGLKNLTKAYELMNYLCVKKDLEIDKLTQEDANNLDLLINTILFNRRYNSDRLIATNTKKPLEKNQLTIGLIEVSNIKLLLFMTADNEGLITIEDCYNLNVSKKHKFNLSIDEKPSDIVCSHIVILKAADIVKSDNFNLNVVIESVTSIPFNSPYSEYVNYFVLELIKAYDMDNSLKDCLTAACKLSQWLGNNEDNPIYCINEYQTIKRERVLNEDEIQKLYQMRKSSENNNMIMCGINLLLENKSDYEYYLKKMSEQEQRDFRDFPIYKLSI